MWHSGEQAMQSRVDGVARQGDAERGPLRPKMSEQHRAFFAERPFVVLGGQDGLGLPWASLATGTPGFLASPDPFTLTARIRPPPADALADAIAPLAALALLGIDFSTRRRNRINGLVTAADADGFTLAVDQAFGNCPKYIRDQDTGPMLARTGFTARRTSAFDRRARALIERAETFFVASWSGNGIEGAAAGMDVSHRGGPAGFVRIAADGGLIVPDYAGNRYFNTLGNVLNTGQAGLLFVDFTTGERLQATGAAKILWDGPEVEAMEGAERAWRFTPAAVNWMT
jgi:predicted pyridoxine 5'-phosphate oxidase superfamily flavin-nucleotide-binding protein